MARFGGGLTTPEEHAHVGTIDVGRGGRGADGGGGARGARAARVCAARASLAAVGQYLQLPLLYATRHSCGVGPACVGEHALLRCYPARDGWFMLVCFDDPPAARRAARAALDGRALSPRAFAHLTVAEACARLAAQGLAAQPLRSMPEMRERYLGARAGRLRRRPNRPPDRDALPRIPRRCVDWSSAAFPAPPPWRALHRARPSPAALVRHPCPARPALLAAARRTRRTFPCGAGTPSAPRARQATRARSRRHPAHHHVVQTRGVCGCHKLFCVVVGNLVQELDGALVGHGVWVAERLPGAEEDKSGVAVISVLGNRGRKVELGGELGALRLRRRREHPGLFFRRR